MVAKVLNVLVILIITVFFMSGCGMNSNTKFQQVDTSIGAGPSKTEVPINDDPNAVTPTPEPEVVVPTPTPEPPPVVNSTPSPTATATPPPSGGSPSATPKPHGNCDGKDKHHHGDHDKDDSDKDDEDKDDKDKDSKESDEYLCYIIGKGVSDRIGSDVAQSIEIEHGVSQDICMSESACLNIVNRHLQKCDGEFTAPKHEASDGKQYTAVKRNGVCAHNPHVRHMDDSEVESVLKNLK